MRRKVQMLGIVAAAIEQPEDEREHGNQNEEHARHRVGGSPHQAVVIFRHRPQHRSDQPELGIDLAIEIGALGRSQAVEAAPHSLSKRSLTWRLIAGLADTNPEANLEICIGIGKRHVGLNQKEHHAAHQIEAHRPDIARALSANDRPRQLARPGQQQTNRSREFSVPSH